MNALEFKLDEKSLIEDIRGLLQIQSVNGGCDEGAPLGFTVEEFQHVGPLYVEKDSKLVTTLQKVYREITGDSREPVSTGGGTYARAFQSAVAFGIFLPGEENMCHKVDEYWSLDSIRTNFQIMANAIKEL